MASNGAEQHLLYLDLWPVGDEGAGFRIHDPPPPLIDSQERPGLTLQTGLVREIHGTLSKNGEPATLVILSFMFISARPDRRFKEAEITLCFANKQRASPQSAGDDPEVVDISPYGHFTINPTLRDLTYKGGARVTTGINASGANIGTEGYLEKVSSMTVVDKGVLTGVAIILGRSCGARNAARFTLVENGTQEDGIPSQLRVAVLLKRNAGKQSFLLFIDVDVKVSWWEDARRRIQRFFGMVPKDLPVIINPNSAKDPGDDKVKAEELRCVDLDSLSDVVSTTVLLGTARTE